MACRIRRYNTIDGNSAVEDMSCHVLREIKEELLAKFRKENGCDKIQNDPYYDDFKNEIEEILEKCRCEIKIDG
jgi:hypothetical protein